MSKEIKANVVGDVRFFSWANFIFPFTPYQLPHPVTQLDLIDQFDQLYQLNKLDQLHRLDQLDQLHHHDKLEQLYSTGFTGLSRYTNLTAWTSLNSFVNLIILTNQYLLYKYNINKKLYVKKYTLKDWFWRVKNRFVVFLLGLSRGDPIPPPFPLVFERDRGRGRKQ